MMPIFNIENGNIFMCIESTDMKRCFHTHTYMNFIIVRRAVPFIIFLSNIVLFWSRDSSVGIATNYGQVRFPPVIDFLFSTVSRQALRPIPPPIYWVPRAISSELKRQEREADHSLPLNTEIKKIGAITPLPHISSWHSSYVIKHRENFTLLPFFRSTWCTIHFITYARNLCFPQNKNHVSQI
jgi:hypothetical protein